MSRFATAGLQTLALSSVNRGLGILIGIVFARTLGAAGKGQLAYAAIALELFVVLSGGLTQAVTHQFAHRGLPGGAVYRAMLRIVALVALPATIVTVLVALSAPSQRVLLWVVPAIPAAIYGEAAIGVLIGAQQIAAMNLQRFVSSSAFALAAIVALLVFHLSLDVVFALWVLAYVAAAIVAAVAVRRFVREGRANWDLVRDQAAFAWKAAVAAAAGFINMRVDVVVVALALDARALGAYTLAVGVAEMMWQVSQPLCWAAFGRIAAAPLAEAAAFTAKLTRHIIAFVVPAGVVLFAVAPVAVTLVYGSAFADAGHAIRWILPGVVAYAVEIPLGYFVMVKLGRPLTIVAIQTVSILVCIAIAQATIRRWGIDGAAFATSVTYAGVVAVKAAIFMRATGVGVVELFVPQLRDLQAFPGMRRIRAATAAVSSRF